MSRDEFEERLLAIPGISRVGASYQKLGYKYDTLYEVVVYHTALGGKREWVRAALHSEDESMADVLEQLHERR